jgi:hypothetical protein
VAASTPEVVAGLPAAAPEEVKLKNGRTMPGRIVRIIPAMVEIDTGNGKWFRRTGIIALSGGRLSW